MVLTCRSGAAGGIKTAKSMAEYMAEKDVPELAERLTAYLGESYRANVPGGNAAIPMRDMHPLAAEMLGIDVTRSLRTDEMTHLLAGRRADAKPIVGKAIQPSTKDKVRVGFTDFTFSLPKSFSIALNLAKTDAERGVLEAVAQRANAALNKLIESHIGGARMGSDGCHGVVPGHMGVVTYHHHSSRPTVTMRDGKDTLIATVPEGSKIRPGEMQRHFHNIFLHATVTDEGLVRAPNLLEAHDRIHEWGAIGHAFLASFGREAGVHIEIDPRTNLSHLPGVPEFIVKEFSSRTVQGEEAARAYASEQGVDWDKASTKVKMDLVKGRVAVAREDKTGRPGDFRVWQQIAADVGYEHTSVIDPDYKWTLPEPGERARISYEAGAALLQDEFKRNAKLNGSALRVAAARGMIAGGIDTPADIEPVLEAFKTEGVFQDGKKTAIITRPEHGKRFGTVTTALHVHQEREAIALIKAGAEDTSGAITKAEYAAAAERVAARRGYNLTSEHGRKQYAMGEAVATGGRVAVGIGGAGVGKTTIAEIVIEAHHTKGYDSVGTTLAWRQTHGLIEAGVGARGHNGGPKLEPDTDHLTNVGIRQAYALEPFLDAAEKGEIKLHPKMLVVTDEVATIGTHQVLRMARLRAGHDFKWISFGDDGQCQAVDAGHAVNLFRHALGAEQVPELIETIRQKKIEDREISALWRKGQPTAAVEAVARKTARGLLEMVPGSYGDVVKAGVDWWEKRKADRAGQENYSIGITVPTNADVRAVGLEVRSRQRARGELQGDDFTLNTIDQSGRRSELAIAVGDKVRLYKRVNASFSNGKHGYFGENGTVADVVSIDRKYGIRLRREDGKVGAIRWRSLQHQETGLAMLSYGSALTINARQSQTLTDHLTLFPAGSAGVNAFSMYPADTRAREDSMIMGSQGAEKAEVIARRPMGDPWVSEATPEEMHTEILKNLARNLARQPTKQLGIDMIEAAAEVNYGTVNAHTASWFRAEAAVHDKPDRPERQQQAAAMQKALVAPLKRLAGPREVREQKRTMRPASQRPKSTPAKRKPSVQDRANHADAFADAIRAAGLVIEGAPEMDGQSHYTMVAGSKDKQKGLYRSFIDRNGRQAGSIVNFKEQTKQTWHADGPVRQMSDQQRAEIEADRNRRETERRQREEEGAARAAWLWNTGRKAPDDHPYLVRKDIRAHGLRQTPGGDLIIPMYGTDRVVRNAQRIKPTAGPDSKRFLYGARKSGLYAQLGEVNSDKPVVMISESFSTGATAYEEVGVPVRISFGASNMMEVARMTRAEFPQALIITVTDNDHHLPRKERPLPNIGMESGQAAASAVGGVSVMPRFGTLETGPLVKGIDPPTDWNDFKAINGPGSVATAIEQQLLEKGIPMPDSGALGNTPKEALRITQAERDAARTSTAPTQPNTAQADALRQAQTEQHRLGHNKRPRA